MDKADWLIDSLTKEITGFIVQDEKIEFDEARRIFINTIWKNKNDRTLRFK